MVNRERVFHIDQECFIIFAEDLSNKKERFLRIGNSMALKQYGEGLTFSSLITPLFLGDAFREPDIFLPGVDKRIIGLQNVIDRFVRFLWTEGVDTNRVLISRADGKGHPTGKKITEDQFIDNIKDKSEKGKHSFASFYDDGNIRVFNKNELMFDLCKSLEQTIDQQKEIEQLTNFYQKYYENSYINSGIIYSGKSLFIFSQNEFACITQSSDWVQDAVVVGINPANVSFLYVASGVQPDSLWLKSFMQREKIEDKNKIRLVIMGQEPSWQNLISEEVFVPVYPQQESVEVLIGSIRLFFQNNRINIYYGSMRLRLIANQCFLESGASIFGEYIYKNKKNPISLSLNEIVDGSLQLQEYFPMIFVGIHGSDSDIYDGRNLDKSSKNILLEQILGVDSDGQMTVRLQIVTKKLPPIPKELNPFCFFCKDFSLDQIKQKYETFYNQLGKKFNLEKDVLILINERYEKLIRDKQFYIDEQQRLFEFIEILDTQQHLQEQKQLEASNINQEQNHQNKLNELQKKNEKDKDSLSDDKKTKDQILDEQPFQEHNLLDEQSEPIPKENKLNNEESEVISEEQKFLDEQPKNDNLPEDTFNAQELLEGGRFDEFADQVKSMRVSHKYEFRDSREQQEWLQGISNKKDKKSNLWWILFIVLFLLLLLGVGFWYGPKILDYIHTKKTESNLVQKKDNQKNIGSNIEIENDVDEMENQNEQISENEIIETNVPIKSVKTSFFYKFNMTVQDQIDLTNEIAVTNKYDKIDQLQEKKFSSKDPHWIYAGNILTMPDGNDITVVDGDTMWSLCEDFLIKEINGYELEIRNILEATKTNQMTIESAKQRFQQIKEETHSQMVRDFIDALLVQDDYAGWNSEIIINQENDI